MKKVLSRKDALDILLTPIMFGTNSIEKKKNLVRKRRKEVCQARPFLLDGERKLAEAWLEKETHSYLWEQPSS